MGRKQDYNFEIYKILVEENRHVHQRWNDNFRIFLIFNPILASAIGYILLNGSLQSLLPQNKMLPKEDVEKNVDQNYHFVSPSFQSNSGEILTLPQTRKAEPPFRQFGLFHFTESWTSPSSLKDDLSVLAPIYPVEIGS